MHDSVTFSHALSTVLCTEHGIPHKVKKRCQSQPGAVFTYYLVDPRPHSTGDLSGPNGSGTTAVFHPVG